jgi:hypothetical protein
MNWHRGLLRVWTLFSVLWGAVVGGVGIVIWYYEPWRPVDQNGRLVMFVTDDLMIALAVATLVPLAVLVFGFAIRWAIRGFHS